MTCVTQCPSQFYHNIAPNECSSCDPSCQNCTGGQPTECTECIPGKIFHQNQCLDQCPAGYSDISGVCQVCGPKCKTCQGTVTTCILCRDDLQMVEAKCQCPTGKNFNQNLECVELKKDQQLLIINKSFDTSTQIVSIEFDNKLEPLKDAEGFTFTLKKSKKILTPKSVAISSDKKYLLVSLDLKENIEQETLQISTENVGLLLTKVSTDVFKYFVSYPIEVPVSYYFTALDEAVKA